LLHCGYQAQARIPPSQSPDTFTVLPAALSLQHTAVRGLPKRVVAGVPAEFTIHPADHFGNRGARGEQPWFGPYLPALLTAKRHTDAH